MGDRAGRTPPRLPPVTQGVALTGKPDEEEAIALLLLRQALTAQAERLTALQEERERERRQLTERIIELRDQLARSEEERREKDRQLTARLTDQRKTGERERANTGTINRWLSWLRTLR